MSVPAKYREIGDFHEYYSGAKVASCLTIFVAGNHEASSYLWELYYGGWVAPNIYYMGAANVLRLGPLRIAGMSGIWKGFDYRKAHTERLPFNQDDIKSFYHVREIDIRKLLQLRTQVDVGISHDWPRAIEKHGDKRRLFNMKPDFEQESNDGSLGNVAAEYVMDRLRPPYWFSAHLHCKFSAIKTYEPPKQAKEEEKVADVGEASTVVPVSVGGNDTNPDEISLDLDDDEPASAGGEQKAEPEEVKGTNEATEELRAQLPAAFARPQRQPKGIPGQPVPEGITNTTVRFLALDKCLPGRKFLQLCEIEPFDSSQATTHQPATTTPRFRLQYDPEWLAITRVFSQFLSIGDRDGQTPLDLGEAHYRPLIEAEEEWVKENIVEKGTLEIPDNFTITAPPHVPGQPESVDEQPDEYTNPQTEAFCALIGVDNLWAATEAERLERKQRGPAPSSHRGGFGGGGGRGRGRGGGRGWRGGRGGFDSRGRGRGRGRGFY